MPINSQAHYITSAEDYLIHESEPSEGLFNGYIVQRRFRAGFQIIGQEWDVGGASVSEYKFLNRCDLNET